MCEAGPPIRQLFIQPNFDGQCIALSGGALDRDIKVTVANDDTLQFTWGEQKNTQQKRPYRKR